MSSLDDAFVEDDPDEEKIAQIINERVKIIKERGEIRGDKKFEQMDRGEQTICCIAAVSAMELKGLREDKKIGPSELADICPIPQGTLKPKLQEIEVLEKDDGEYYLPGYNLDKAIDILEDES